MNLDESELKHLSREQCLRLLASVPIGRVVYTRQALPAVELVNFVLDGGDIVFRTAADGKLEAALRGAVVAFEADSLDYLRHTGWSVTVVGQCQSVTDPVETDRLRKTRLTPWAPGARENYVRIPPTMVNGRQLTSRWLEVADHARSV